MSLKIRKKSIFCYENSKYEKNRFFFLIEKISGIRWKWFSMAENGTPYHFFIDPTWKNSIFRSKNAQKITKKPCFSKKPPDKFKSSDKSIRLYIIFINQTIYFPKCLAITAVMIGKLLEKWGFLNNFVFDGFYFLTLKFIYLRNQSS